VNKRETLAPTVPRRRREGEDRTLERLWGVDTCAACGAPIMLGEGRGMCASCKALPTPAAAPTMAAVAAVEVPGAWKPAAGLPGDALRDVA
jgi:hypothetical protein